MSVFQKRDESFTGSLTLTVLLDFASLRREYFCGFFMFWRCEKFERDIFWLHEKWSETKQEVGLAHFSFG